MKGTESFLITKGGGIMKKYPVSYEEWGDSVNTSQILPPEMRGLYKWLHVHPDGETSPENYQAYVNFLALHNTKLGKLLRGEDDV